MRGTTLFLTLAIVLLGGFYTGLKVGEAHASGPSGSPRPAASQPAGKGTGQQVRAPAGIASGAITETGSGTITVHDRTTGKDVKVAVGPNTQIQKESAGSVSDLTRDASVTVQGQAGSDGSLQARMITVGEGRPQPSPTQ